jgi:pseudouridine 5'-phosphatase
LIEELNLPISHEQFDEIHRKKLNELFPFAQVLPGAFRLIKHLQSQNIKIAIATSSSKN